MAYLLILAAFTLSGCGAGRGMPRALSGPAPPSFPFSTQSGFFSREDSSLFELSGISGAPVTHIKWLAGLEPHAYQQFDGSTVFLPDGIAAATTRKYERTMHQWVEDRLRLHGLTVGAADTSQAGVSIVYTPFRSMSGRNAYEIVIIVFDRKKGAHILKDSYEKQGLHVVLESAVWMSATRYYPTMKLPPWPDPTDRKAAALFKTLFDAAFANFLAIEK